MVRTLLVLAWLLPLPVSGGTAADIARAVRENSFDREECYRVRDLTILKEDIRVYLTDGYLIFAKPVAGRRMAAVFSTDVEGGDGEVILLPPDRAGRWPRSSMRRIWMNTSARRCCSSRATTTSSSRARWPAPRPIARPRKSARCCATWARAIR